MSSVIEVLNALQIIVGKTNDATSQFMKGGIFFLSWILNKPLEGSSVEEANVLVDGFVTRADEIKRRQDQGHRYQISGLDQPPPQKTQGPAIWDLVITDMQERHRIGVERYGTPLQAFNGHNALVDAYQEALDMCVYLRQAIEERKKP